MDKKRKSYKRKGFDVNELRGLDALYPIIRRVQVNIPFRMLCESYLTLFTECNINPEVGLDAVALEKYDPAVFRDVCRKLHEKGLSITLHAPFMDLSPGSTDPDVRALTRRRFEQTLRVTEVFKPKSVVCHAGYDLKRYGFIEDLWLENSLETWSWFALRAGEQGVRLMLENVYEHDPVFLSKLLERLRHLNVGFCLDVGHHAAFASTPMNVWLNALGPYLGELHLHDNRGLRDDPSRMGDGIVDFRALLESLKRERKEPPIITLEPHREEDLIPNLKYLEKVWPW